MASDTWKKLWKEKMIEYRNGWLEAYEKDPILAQIAWDRMMRGNFYGSEMYEEATGKDSNKFRKNILEKE